MNNITKLAATLVIACIVPVGASLAADKPAKATAAKAADAKPVAAKAADTKPAAADDSAKAAGPKLEMASVRRNPGRDIDLRHCLDLGSNTEIIKCAEQGNRKE